jgi:hypothetical protein
MMFAVIDYVAYRLKRGKYSAASIEAEGGKLASPGNFPEGQFPQPAAIIVFHTRDSFLSWLVMYFTNSVWSHSAVATYDGEFVEVTVDQGTIEHPFADSLNSKDYVKYGLPRQLTADQQAGIVAAAQASVGNVRFSWFGAIRLGFYILMGRHPTRHPRLYADILLLLSMFYWLGRNKRLIKLTSTSLVFLYIVILSKNRKYRKSDNTA